MSWGNALCWEPIAFGFEAWGPASSCLAKPSRLLVSVFSAELSRSGSGLASWSAAGWLQRWVCSQVPVYFCRNIWCLQTPIDLHGRNWQIARAASAQATWCSSMQVRPQHLSCSWPDVHRGRRGAPQAGDDNTRSVSLTNNLGARNTFHSAWLPSFAPDS